MHFNKGTKSSTHYHAKTWNILSPKDLLCALLPLSPPLDPGFWPSIVLPFQELHTNGIIQYCLLWLASFT